MLNSARLPVAFDAEPSASDPARPTLLCFSHLRWDFVFQRPQHLMSRFARTLTVVFWEEPMDIGPKETAFLKVREAAGAPGVRIVVPHIPEGLDEAKREAILKRLLDAYAAGLSHPLISWYYTPMMLSFSQHLDASAVVFDAMDELSKFRFAPPRLLELEQALIDKADVVFTGGTSLYEAKKGRHDNVHCFPSSVDRAHFTKARAGQFEPADQEDLPRPRLGFYGVIDERFDIDLLGRAADMRPDWQFIMVGPVVKISEYELPKRSNIHYLGGKSYAELPRYLSGWDVALMPFAMNESTEFISPTKTPEYLAGGRPVVSTPVRDVVRHYGHLKGFRIASTAEEFFGACDDMLAMVRAGDCDWLAEADLMLSATSWDITQARMAGLIEQVIGDSQGVRQPALLAAAE
jgi:UDP-galactopyranose mutase